MGKSIKNFYNPMTIKKTLYFIIIFLFCVQQAKPQQPFSTNWKTIKTPETKIIYPSEIEQDAYRIAVSMKTVFEADTASLNEKPRRVPLLMPNLPAISNGYTTLFPYMMLWYPLPFDNCSDIGLSEWYQALAVHEYRHIVQYQANNHYFTKLASILTGAYARAALRYSVPEWWYEGDAVYAETVLSSGGRGRIATFDMPFAAILNSRSQNYKYDKMLLRSYKDYLPNHYPLGYLLVTRARREFGVDIWQKTSKRSSAYSFWPWAFSTAFRHYSKINLAKNYSLTMNELRSFYNNRIKNTEITPSKIINDTLKRCYTSYTITKFFNDSTIIAIKSAINTPTCFVLIDTLGHETKLFDTEATTFDYKNNILVWSTEVPDPRWTLKNFSDIATYDFKTGKKYRITQGQRYFSPVLSANGNFLATIEFNEKRECKLLIFKILKKNNGQLFLEKTRTFPAQYLEYLRTPVWIDNKQVAYISNYKNKNAIIKINISNGQTDTLLPYGYEIVNSLEKLNDDIIYESEHSGISAIWQIDTKSYQRYMIVSRKYGAFKPTVSPDKKILIFSDYTSKGYNIGAIKTSDINKVPENDIKINKLDYFSPLLEYEPKYKVDTVAFIKLDTLSLKSKKYRFFYDPIRIYGWMPNIDGGTISGIINSSNTLGTLNIGAGANYYTQEDYWRYYINATYSGFYPVFSFSANWGNESNDYWVMSKTGAMKELTFYWNEKIYSGNITFPLNFSRYVTNRRLNLSAGYAYYNITNKITDNYDDLGNGNFSTVSFSANYSSVINTAYRDFFYRLGWSAGFCAKTSVDSHREGRELDFKLNIYLPGFAKQHYFTLSGVCINQNKSQNQQKLYLFYNEDASARGYKMIRTQKFNKITADYWFPICYPDGGIPGAIWIKRIRASVFGDIAKSQILSKNYNYLSYGAKFVFDINILRISNNISAGLWFANPIKDNTYSNSSVGLILSYEM